MKRGGGGGFIEHERGGWGGGGKEMVEGQLMVTCANVVFLCFHFVGGVQIEEEEGWVGGRRSGCSGNRGGGGGREGTIGGGACSQLARVEVRGF